MYPLVDTDLPVVYPIHVHFPVIFERYFQMILIVNFVLYHFAIFLNSFFRLFYIIFHVFIFVLLLPGLGTDHKNKGVNNPKNIEKMAVLSEGQKSLGQRPQPTAEARTRPQTELFWVNI